MPSLPHGSVTRIRPARDFYRSSLAALTEARVPYVVGGAFALRHFADVYRKTKDLDVFMRASDVPRAAEALAVVGARVETPFPHWLAKAHRGEWFMDIIFNSANGLCPVDEAWFSHATPGVVLDEQVLLCPVEEVILTKCFVMERERFDGADIHHLLVSCGPTLDWRRLIDRFGPHYRVLLGHLVFFAFAYPHERDAVPSWVTSELMDRFRAESAPEADRVCRGTLLSREQYLVDVYDRGYADARLPPRGSVSERDLVIWTAAIDH